MLWPCASRLNLSSLNLDGSPKFVVEVIAQSTLAFPRRFRAPPRGFQSLEHDGKKSFRSAAALARTLVVKFPRFHPMKMWALESALLAYTLAMRLKKELPVFRIAIRAGVLSS